MPTPISVVVPTLNSQDSLCKLLESLDEGIKRGLIREVIISDGGSEDNTAKIAKTAGCIFIKGEKGRGIQIAKATKACRENWILILHSDCFLTKGWSKRVPHFLKTPGNSYYFLLLFDSSRKVAKVMSFLVNCRSRLLGLPYGDQGLFISKSLLASIKGYPKIPLMEDVEVARKLRGRLYFIPEYIITSAKKYEENGWVKNGLSNLYQLFLYYCGVSTKKLWGSYYGSKLE